MVKTYDDLKKAIDARVEARGIVKESWGDKPYTAKYMAVAGLTKFDVDNQDMDQETIDTLLWCMPAGNAFANAETKSPDVHVPEDPESHAAKQVPAAPAAPASPVKAVKEQKPVVKEVKSKAFVETAEAKNELTEAELLDLAE